MGPGTGQKLRPLESKDVSFSVRWWLERLTAVWDICIFIFTYDPNIKYIMWVLCGFNQHKQDILRFIRNISFNFDFQKMKMILKTK
jgi:hypothetical protein